MQGKHQSGLLTEGGHVGVQSGGAAGVQEEHVGAFSDDALADEVDHAGESLAAVHGVEKDGFGLGEELHGFDHAVIGQGVAGPVTYPNTKNQILHQWDNTKKAHLLPQLAILDVQIETVTGMTQLAYQKMLDLDSTLVSNDKINTDTNNTAAASIAKDLYSVNTGNTQQVLETVSQQSFVNNPLNEQLNKQSYAYGFAYDNTNNMTPIPKNF